MRGYNHKEIEEHWQGVWEKQKLYATPDTVEGKDNFYTLVEFAYPSGNLHVGHWYAFAVMDIFARYHRMTGKNVLFPMGFDAFGLPAENAAIKHKTNPREWTYQNISYMRDQLKSMGASFDWSRAVVTSDPEYYTWTQWLFLEFFKKGLVYRAETEVNWCPSCKTVLANEQVVAGHCERCGGEVERRMMRQWNLKITDYAERLIDDLESLDWPEEIKTAQKNWIGESNGALLPFELRTNDLGLRTTVEVFTTRPDTLFGATYLVLSPEHKEIPNLKSQITNGEEVEEYIKNARKKTEIERTAEGKEKTGVELKGVTAINPATKEEIPVWIADYVLAHYGTGAIMAVPAHDGRDWDFAKKYNLPIIEVVLGGEVSGQVYIGEGKLINSGEFDGVTSEEAREAITKAVNGQMKTTYKLRDWTVSRQRYWGCPIPLVFCEHCAEKAKSKNEKVKTELSKGELENPGWFSVSELPVELPEVEDYVPAGDGKSPLAKVVNFVNTTCPKCGGAAKRETDTLDTFVDSSWYFLRYTDPHNEKEFASREKQDAWMPIDFYSGGAEHTTMHVLYSRFFHKALFDIGLVPNSEPYTRRMNRGLILGPDGNKMSKSKGNIIAPDDVVERLGADTVRIYLAFIGPYNEAGAYPWSSDGIVGVRRFLERVWRTAQDAMKLKTEDQKPKMEKLLHQTIQKVGEDIAELKFNTAVSQLMIFLNAADKEGITTDQQTTFLRIIAPFAPHLAEELWHELGHKKSIHLEPWPEYDPALVKEDVVTIVVQVNGKTRGQFKAPQNITEAEAQKKALALPGVKKWLEGEKPKRVIYVPGRLVNIVV